MSFRLLYYLSKKLSVFDKNNKFVKIQCKSTTRN